MSYRFARTGQFDFQGLPGRIRAAVTNLQGNYLEQISAAIADVRSRRQCRVRAGCPTWTDPARPPSGRIPFTGLVWVLAQRGSSVLVDTKLRSPAPDHRWMRASDLGPVTGTGTGQLYTPRPSPFVLGASTGQRSFFPDLLSKRDVDYFADRQKLNVEYFPDRQTSTLPSGERDVDYFADRQKLNVEYFPDRQTSTLPSGEGNVDLFAERATFARCSARGGCPAYSTRPELRNGRPVATSGAAITPLAGTRVHVLSRSRLSGYAANEAFRYWTLIDVGGLQGWVWDPSLKHEVEVTATGQAGPRGPTGPSGGSARPALGYARVIAPGGARTSGHGSFPKAIPFGAIVSVHEQVIHSQNDARSRVSWRVGNAYYEDWVRSADLAPHGSSAAYDARPVQVPFAAQAGPLPPAGPRPRGPLVTSTGYYGYVR